MLKREAYDRLCKHAELAGLIQAQTHFANAFSPEGAELDHELALHVLTRMEEQAENLLVDVRAMLEELRSEAKG